MIYSGLFLGCFIVYHLLHFTVRVSYPADRYVDFNKFGEQRRNASLNTVPSSSGYNGR
mgnify:CR=1 FL=1